MGRWPQNQADIVGPKCKYCEFKFSGYFSLVIDIFILLYSQSTDDLFLFVFVSQQPLQ